MPKCGSGHDHPDVASVRECYAQKYNGFTAREDVAVRNENNGPAWERSAVIAGRALRAESFTLGEAAAREDGSGYAAGVIRRAVADRHGVGREEQRIQREEDARRADFGKRRAAWSLLAPGGYAVESRTGNNDLDFWWLDRPTEGRWAGYTFVRRVIGGRPNQDIRKPEQMAVLDLLAGLTSRQAAYAQETFGVEIGRCYICGRTLTDEASRRAGIGPVCAAR